MNLTSSHLYFLWARRSGQSVAPVMHGEYVTPTACHAEEMHLRSYVWWEHGIPHIPVYRDGIWNYWSPKAMQNRWRPLEVNIL